MQTPQTTTLTITAGARVEWPVQGQAVLILSITPAASIQAAFGNDSYQTFYPGLVYPAADKPFQSVRFFNATGVTQTLVVCAGALTLNNNGVPDLLTAIAVGNALLTTIETETANLDVPLSDATSLLTTIETETVNLDVPLSDATALLVAPDTPTLVPQTLVDQTGVGSTQILAANPNRKWCFVSCDLGNAGYIYLGFTNAVTAVQSFFDMMAGGTWRETYRGAVWACSENGTENVRAYEME
jgi:hypothetical protein